MQLRTKKKIDFLNGKKNNSLISSDLQGHQQWWGLTVRVGEDGVEDRNGEKGETPITEQQYIFKEWEVYRHFLCSYIAFFNSLINKNSLLHDVR